MEMMTNETMRRTGHGDAAPTFRFRVPVDVRFRDIDALGHVNNAVYFTYFEIARIAYMEAVHERTRDIRGRGLVIAKAQCRYRSAALYGERLLVEVAALGVRSRSFELRYRVTTEESGRLVAEGRTVQVAYDSQTGRATALDPALRSAIARHEGVTLGSNREG